MIDKSIKWNKHLPELSRIIMDFKAGEPNLEVNLRANALLNKVEAEAIEELIKRFEDRAKQYQAIGTSAADGLACQQLDIADAIRPSLRSLKQKTNGTDR